MRLADLKNRTVPVDFDFDGETVKVVYRPSVHTSAFEDEMQAAMQGNDAQALADLLARLVESIDVTDDDGAPIACDADTFYTVLPLTFMAKVWEAVGKDLRPGEAKGETSAAG